MNPFPTKPDVADAVKQFLRAHRMPTTVAVALEKVECGYARARVTRPGAPDDPAFALLKQEQKAWRVLGFGTFFDGPFYDQHGVPGAIRF